MSNIKILESHKSHNLWIYLEEEDNPLLGENKYCTHAGNSADDRFWGNYAMDYPTALKDYADRIKRGY